jgi:hypothetical protein
MIREDHALRERQFSYEAVIEQMRKGATPIAPFFRSQPLLLIFYKISVLKSRISYPSKVSYIFAISKHKLYNTIIKQLQNSY